MNIAPPPAQFDGKFSAFYERHVEPNLPSADRVQAFDSLLRQHLSDEDPVHVVRYIRGQTRGTVCRTRDGWRILPTDNAPVWWTHALLHSGGALPEDADALFAAMPYHLFKVGRLQTLNSAGDHAAHILSAKNRDTDWQGWTRSELARRMLVNIHPCNVFLVAKPEWTRNGGRSDIIAWVTNAYLRRYGATMERLLADGAPSASSTSGPVEDPDYRYNADAADNVTDPGPVSLSRQSPRQTSPKSERGSSRNMKRPMIWRHLVGKGVSLDISMEGARYVLPHDDLVAWVGGHTTALETASWKGKGIYSWSRAKRAMVEFLQNYAIEE
ncbi:hypothetical protein [Mesorhizobium sp.]|uniref:hypothetical protein n=1 Tax=Mesorhizobium sp. TaxID=1871066 RepID=UPI000FE57887|nr:hypothetical protein [Mesorhizobium sp.]RWO51193.1 MAG: hypothetical protein EOS13_20825 [Mesorhizobium sp.]TIN25496.1 MAG: hypothetical protein E5Y19_18035 [Mesorhizobium sp.]TIN42830.1 MAG: hypothetical protein E5Y13_03370 [Mesorhizobium sp.]TJU88014.1 MAG: hypothetical protein E5Y15_05860 [Mesorhizobium sp.]TJU91769.1 MAG: hypothetical protein E5Y10_04080 [Mesorhizobium sp.]